MCTTECYTAIKEKEILPFVTTWMDLESIMLSEISQMEKDKYCMIAFVCGIKQNKNKDKQQTQRYRE